MATALSVTSPTPTCSEHELVAAVRNGSDRAFEVLYCRFRPRISGYIYKMVGDHARAEDIAQEVFISALRRLRQTDRPIAFKPWIYEIAKNACIDEYRRTRRAREVSLDTPNDRSEDDRALISSAPSPDAAVAGKQSLQDLRGAFHGLSENHHKVIVMREFEGLSYDQIGEKLGMTRPVVESTLFRARRKLTEEYQELVSGRRCEHVQALIAGEQRHSLLELGIRERRQLARHLSHCQPCRREARLAGIDESLFQAPGLAGKLGALLPFPWLWRRRGHGDRASLAAGSHPIGSLPSLQTIAQFAGLVVPSTGFGRIAAAAAATGVAAAGIGGGALVAHGGVPQRPGEPRIHAAPAQRSASASTSLRRATAAAGTNVLVPRRGGKRAAGGTAPAAVYRFHGHPRARAGVASPKTPSAKGSGGGSSAGGGRTATGHSATPTPGGGSQRTVSIGGVRVPGGGKSPGVSVKLPGVSAGKVKVPGVAVPAPKVPQAGSAVSGAAAAGSAAVGGAAHGASGVVHGVTGAVQGTASTLPKPQAPNPGSVLGH